MAKGSVTVLATDLGGGIPSIMGGSSFPINWQDLIASTSEVDNPEFSKVLLDSNNMLLYGLRWDGTEYTPDLSESTITIVTAAAPIVEYVKGYI
jgi:hypothetical protein